MMKTMLGRSAVLGETGVSPAFSAAAGESSKAARIAITCLPENLCLLSIIVMLSHSAILLPRCRGYLSLAPTCCALLLGGFLLRGLFLKLATFLCVIRKKYFLLTTA
jgi:hypothetical protein